MPDEQKKNGLIRAIENMFSPTSNEVKHEDSGDQGKQMQGIECAEEHTDRDGRVIPCAEWRRTHSEHT